RGVTTLRERAETNRLLGVDSRLIDPEEIAELVPGLNINCHQPVLAGLYDPPGGIIRHDAVVWGYARGCDRLGTQIHPHTEVTAIRVEDGKIAGVVTNRGEISTRAVVNATAGWCSIIGAMVGIDLP